MEAIICKNDVNIVLIRIQEFLKEGGTIGGVCVVEQNADQVVILLDEKHISEDSAKVWWSGFSQGMKTALE